MIEIKNVSKSYSKQSQVLSDINLKIDDHELVVLLGESGSGKTTLLKMINRLVDITEGNIEIDGEPISQLDPVALRRKIGYVVQQTGLFPHLTIKENIELVCRAQGLEKDETEKRVNSVMNMVGLDPDQFLYRYPKQLSGGQAQRIGVARAYATDSKIILMDEPFSALDPITRKELQAELLRLQAECPKTIVFVTHDIDEAIRLADRIVLLSNGKIEQFGTPRDLLTRPCSKYVSEFLGAQRLWDAPWLIRCKDIMTSSLTTVDIDESLETVWQIIKNDNVKAVFVQDKNGAIVGKITEKILIRNSDVSMISQAMKKCFDFAHEDDSLSATVKLMNEKNVLYLPIVDDDMRPVGMLSMTDLMDIFEKNILNETAVN